MSRTDPLDVDGRLIHRQCPKTLDEAPPATTNHGVRYFVMALAVIVQVVLVVLNLIP